MENPFAYRRNGAALHNELAELVSSGQSAVLLGLRDLGKRYVLRKLSRKLASEGSVLLVEIEFPHEPAMLESTAVQVAVKESVVRAAPGFSLDSLVESSLLDAVKQLCDRQSRAVVLVASNVDSLAHHLAQLLLREVRVLVEKFHLTAVLTGEENLGNLIYGPESVFACAHQFVLQGFYEPEFLGYMRRRHEIARIPFTDAEACLQRLYFHTDGNIYLARTALWAWLETRARARDATDQKVGPEEFAEFLRTFPVTDACGMDVFHSTTRVVARSPETWDDLENLKCGREILVAPGSAPRVIEFAGLAVREDARLRFASQIMEQFARRYYDDCRLGDLHAVHGDWEKAFAFYLRMPPERRLRPGGASDVPRFALVIKAFTACLHVAATRRVEDGEGKLRRMQEKLDHLKVLFVQGCQLLLGVSDVSFWTFILRWEPQQGESLDPKVRSLAALILNMADRTKIGWQKLSFALAMRGALAVLPSVRPDCRDAVVVSDVCRTVTISQERQEFLHELLEQFASAYDHCIANLGTYIRLKAREEHLRIATAIVSALGETFLNPREALKAAGQELLKLGYRRIMFALVDSKRQCIRGISDCIGEPPAADVAKETNWSFAGPAKDIQPWVVVKGKPCVVDDWPTWELRKMVPAVNADLCSRAGTRPSFAVVPMLIRIRRRSDKPDVEEVFGTIHVERGDGLPPSKEDIEDLLEFGRQMAAAAHQSERVASLLDALDCDQDSFVILDDDNIVRFANKVAARRFGITSGWHEANTALRLPASQFVTKAVSQVIASSNPWAHHDTSSKGASHNREAFLCMPLPDWRIEKNGPLSITKSEQTNPAIGAVLQVRNLTGLQKVFSALQKVAQRATDRESTTEALLNCVTDIGYRSGRFYAVDPQDHDLLLSVRASGLPKEESEKFNHSGYTMRRQDTAARETWWCLVQNQPRIYQWKPLATTGTSEISPYGLSVFNIPMPLFHSSWKKPGDVWVDLPLCGTGRVIGKLTIDCGVNLHCDLQPEDFELLKLFSALLGALLDALDRKETWIREAADRAMATCAHNIRTKLAALAGFAARYQAAAPGNAEIEELNQLHQPAVDGCFRQVTRIKETFAGMQLQRLPTPIKTLLSSTVNTNLGKERKAGKASWRILCSKDLTFSVDPDRLRNALEELLANSRMMLPPGSKLEVVIAANFEKRGSRDWLRLNVRDNGPGIPPEKREQIFLPFFSERPYGRRGTGLGLSYVRRVVEAHEGKVYVESGSDPGTIFIIEIPAPIKQP